MPKRLTRQQVNKRVSHLGFEFLEDYVNTQTKCTIRCKCEYERQVRPNDILTKNKYSCPVCSPSIGLPVPLDVVNFRLRSCNIVCLDDFVNTQTKCTALCLICQNKWSSSPHNLLSGSKCPKCSKQKMSQNKKITFEKFLLRARKIHGNFFQYDEQSYDCISKHVRIRCPIHGWFSQLAYCHTDLKQKCPCCANGGKYSKNVVLIVEHLNKFDIETICEFNMGLTNPISGAKLYFDICVPSVNVLIEVHGEQHYNESHFFNKLAAERKEISNIEEFQYRQRLDDIKKQWAKENNYIYLEIPYTLSDKEIINKVNELCM